MVNTGYLGEFVYVTMLIGIAVTAPPFYRAIVIGVSDSINAKQWRAGLDLQQFGAMAKDPILAEVKATCRTAVETDAQYGVVAAPPK